MMDVRFIACVIHTLDIYSRAGLNACEVHTQTNRNLGAIMKINLSVESAVPNHAITAPRKHQSSCGFLAVRSISFCALFSLSLSPAHSQVTLTGLLQQGAQSTGQTAGSPIWNTVGNQTNFAKLYVTQPNTGYTGSFLNNGNGAGASIDYTLTPGAYEFFFLNDPFTANDPGHYGLNLFFDGNNVNPGISAFSPSGVSSANAVPAGLATLSLAGGDNTVSAPGSLSYAADGALVTLTAYGFGPPGTFGGPPIDRVGNLNDAPDGDPDGVGFFDLTVTAIPEPSASTMLCMALLILFSRRFHRLLCGVLVRAWRRVRLVVN
jgi:hypothetical protein